MSLFPLPDGNIVVGVDSTLAPMSGKSNLASDSTMARRLNEMEENIMCSICMERPRNMAFLCGHTVCSDCGDELKVCHMCRKPIHKKIQLYSWGVHLSLTSESCEEREDTGQLDLLNDWLCV